jgi:Mg-chelatase subunit ChlD
MKSKKLLLIALLLGAACLAWPAGIDVVVMVDISESMFPVFDDVVNYLLRDLLENRLHQGDSFHLLSFADAPEQEIRVEIEESADIAAVIDRILLLKPLGQYTDLIAAVDFLYEYTGAIPEENEKLILLLTDGIHDPPPGSPNRLEEEDALARLLESSEKIRREGWDVHILRMPGGQIAAVSPDQGETAHDFLDELSRQLESDVLEYEDADKENLSGQLTGFSTIVFPGPLGGIRRRFDAVFQIRNHSEDALSFTLVEVDSSAGELLRRPVTVTVPAEQTEDLVAPLRLPREIEPGRQSLGVSLQFSDPEARIGPLQGELQFDYAPRIGWRIPRLSVLRVRAALQRLPLHYLLYVLAALILIGVIILLVFVVRRRLQEASFDRLFAGVVATRGGKRGIRPLIMKVDSQNPNIGSRNIHPVPPGSRRSVGGDGSTFLIYYLAVPRRIGDIRNDGKRYSFIPRKQDYFTDLSKPLHDCLDKPIRALSERGREVTFHFHEYVSPLEQINQLMRSVPRYHIGDVPLKHPQGQGDAGRTRNTASGKKS